MLAGVLVTVTGSAGAAVVPGFRADAAVVPAHPRTDAGMAAGLRPGAVYRWPLDAPVRIVRPFDPPPRPWLPGHRGVDLAGAAGDTVRSAGPGVVRFAGPIAGRTVVSVDHAGGLRTTYEPVEARVRPGDRVAAGTPLGRLAAGHRGCPAACLHWGLRRNGTYLDPLALLGMGRVRLLPLRP